MGKPHLHNYLAIAAVLVIAQSADLIDVRSDLLTYLYGLNALIDYAVLVLICMISNHYKLTNQNYIIALICCQIAYMLVHTLGAWTELLYALRAVEPLAAINDYYCFALRAILAIEVLIMLSVGNGIYRRRKLGNRLYNPAIIRADSYIANQHNPDKKTRRGYF